MLSFFYQKTFLGVLLLGLSSAVCVLGAFCEDSLRYRRRFFAQEYRFLPVLDVHKFEEMLFLGTALKLDYKILNQDPWHLQWSFHSPKGFKNCSRILITSGVHGDEVLAIPIIMKTLMDLSRHLSSCLIVDWLPMLHPAAIEIGRRRDDLGVDLNRHFAVNTPHPMARKIITYLSGLESVSSQWDYFIDFHGAIFSSKFFVILSKHSKFKKFLHNFFELEVDSSWVEMSQYPRGVSFRDGIGTLRSFMENHFQIPSVTLEYPMWSSDPTAKTLEHGQGLLRKLLLDLETH